MIRNILAALAGYMLMAGVSILALAVMWFALGSEFAYVGDTTLASTGWSMGAMAGGFVGALAGGSLTTGIGRPPATAAKILVGLIAVLGVLFFFLTFGGAPPVLPAGVSVHNLGFAEAGQYSVTPTWYAATIPLVGMLGAWLGSGRFRANAQAG